MATKKASAAQIAARKKFSDIMKAGGFKKNPLTRVKKSSPSMATGKAPSTRLKKRRAKTAKAPAGYYANPKSLTAGKRLVSKHGTGVITAKIYKDTEFNEYQTHFYKNGVHMGEKPVIYTDDINDAKDTVKMALAQMNARQKNPIILISDTPKKRTTTRRVNPVAKSVTKKSYSNFPYVVEVKREGFKSAYGNIPAQFEMHAGFQTKAEASDLAKMIAAQYPNVTVRVKSYK
jgi:hypoxanthine phosphoribosyltransferase